MSDTITSQRSSKLRTLFARILTGKVSLTTGNAKQFLEAICDQQNPSTCIQRLVASEDGYSALQASLSSATSPSFLNGPIANFLNYLEAPELKTVCGGQVLRRILLEVANTPLTWDALIDAARSNKLTDHGLGAFSWLLLQLLSLPTDQASSYICIAQDESIQKHMLESSNVQVRLRAQRIIHVTSNITATRKPDVRGPGGRNDNDFEDIRKISILPTPDELASKDPYLPRPSETGDSLKTPEALAFHTDAQFRLLREDMLRDLREEIQIALDQKKGRRRGFCIENLSMIGALCDERQPWSLQLRCLNKLPQLTGKNEGARKKFLQENPKFLKHETVACLVVDNDVLTLGTLIRDEDLLAQKPSILCVQIPEVVVDKALLRLKTARNIKLVQLSTAVFAYEPVLKQLKEIKELSLADDILRREVGKSLPPPDYQLDPAMLRFIERLETNHSLDLKDILNLPTATKLDESQSQCFLNGLGQRLSVIHGPPGTGKSFIGSLIVKAIYDHSMETILVVCYTHHALDQFVEDLMNLRIPTRDIVRLGSAKKATPRTQAASIYQSRSSVRLTPTQHGMLTLRKTDVTAAGKGLRDAFTAFQQANFSKSDILEHLEFKSDGPAFHDAFEVPEEKNGMMRVGKKGKRVDPFYLLDRWMRGKDAGIFQRVKAHEFREVWRMLPKDRIEALNEWRREMLQELLVGVRDSGTVYNSSLKDIGAIHMEKDLTIMRQKRIIACTTTAAAKYVQALQSISPGVLLVEEAGEILESHVLTALGPDTKHLILIGDHKQLRPKVHYELSVEKGDGYDLNRSLFERLILREYPHQTLTQQHRMRPELSTLVRQLTYPDLTDAPRTQNRPNLRGFTDNLVFVSHEEPEIELTDVPDWKDAASTSSKKNMFEAKMTLKCVRYLGQQGYRTDNIAVLTPYLGQLRLLLDELGKDNDPVLNDLDSHDLVRAGLMPAASANVGKPRIRISTIDNFQGEESDIVVISLTRSNARNDIGFMTSPERLNVLLSRARNALILIGNAQTFMGSRRGGELWQRFIAMLRVGNHLYDGFPVRCERHLDRSLLLRSPEEFDKECPDGGCTEPCGTMLNCGLHKCPQYCHQLHDHSKMPCERIVESKCAKGHKLRRKCHQSQSPCRTCELDDERRKREIELDFDIQTRRDEALAKHAAHIADLSRQIRTVRERVADKRLAAEQSQALKQKKHELEVAKKLAESAQPAVDAGKSHASANNATPPSEAPTKASTRVDDSTKMEASAQSQKGASIKEPKDNEHPKSVSEMEWERQKRVDGASNDAIDALMDMTGLEDVKSKILGIKAKIETVARQGTDMKRERLGMVMLGNPGTGKTTVARLYAKFLASVQAIPGNEFVEVTGSSLANEGVPGAQKRIEAVIKSGGGAFFLDEAYQLASGNNAGGKAVLDFLLAEIEERVGKIVFILAGYTKEMEKFFEHNPGFDSRMPHRLTFADYTDAELRTMLAHLIEKKYGGRASVEDGLKGLYVRILIRRLGRGRGKEGYGNARALENVWAKVTERQATRINQERIAGRIPDDLYFAKEDLIGPEPHGAIQRSEAWKELQSMTGLTAVKQSVKALINRIQRNYFRELAEKPPIEVSLNRVFLGSPGTGKTTVAKLYASILGDVGLLSKAEVVSKTPADFIGSVLGESEKNTKGIIKSTQGKVLLIDEAYGLYPGGTSAGSTADPYKTAVIDTIVADVQSTPGEDQCVLLLGYKDQITEMMEKSNPGLSRRFPLSDAFHFDDFNDEELKQVLELKLKKQGLGATEEAKSVAIEVLRRARDRPNFGNAGEVENLISRAKQGEQNRSLSMDLDGPVSDILFLPQDFDENFDRATKPADSSQSLFADIVGCEELISKLERYQRIVVKMKAMNKDPRDQIPFNFIFKGPPGTGKTTIARKMSELFYTMGILSTKEYVESSASDLVAQFVGQSAPKTRDVLTRGLGKVLFIDEAYRLCDGEFGREAVNELVDSLTKPQFMGKLVVILAGYTDDINHLLKINPGLASRFPEEVMFQNMKPEECLRLLSKELQRNDIQLPPEFFDTTCKPYLELIGILNELSGLSSWGNGRDVHTISKSLTGTAFESAAPDSPTLILTVEDISQALKSMLKSQKARCADAKHGDGGSGQATKKFLNQILSASPLAPFRTSTSTKQSMAAAEKEQKVEETMEPRNVHTTQRDPGVSDATWQQLQANIAANEVEAKSLREAVAAQEQDLQAVKSSEDASGQALEELEKSAIQSENDSDQKLIDELKRKYEEERLHKLALKRAREEAEAKLRKAREEEEKNRRQEAEAQRKLRDMGVCPVGFRWVKGPSGYRCQGGAHFVSNGQLGM